MKVPTAPYELISFHDPESITDCRAMSDRDIGGFSHAALDWIPPLSTPRAAPHENTKGHIRFHGNISIELPANRPEIHRSGYAAWRTLSRPPTIFGRSFWDIDPYTYLALRVKSDGRKYFVNLQSQTIVTTDIHQYRLYARRPGEWETVLIKWHDFVRTNHGTVVEPQGELLRQKIRTIGVGLVDRVPGPFDLCIERIWATNQEREQDVSDDSRREEGQLKSTHGQRITWNEDKS